MIASCISPPAPNTVLTLPPPPLPLPVLHLTFPTKVQLLHRGVARISHEVRVG